MDSYSVISSGNTKLDAGLQEFVNKANAVIDDGKKDVEFSAGERDLTAYYIKEGNIKNNYQIDSTPQQQAANFKQRIAEEAPLPVKGGNTASIADASKAVAAAEEITK